jgi:ribosomal protein L21
MIAIVEIGGKQYKVAPKSQVQVDLLETPEGEEFNLDKVLLKSEDNGSNCQVGQPYNLIL